ncbi:MAG: hypothetical protein CMP81_18770 [Fulvimarina sp.]|nr:hypothetical protein [Fulvimarina sp.]
MPSWRLQGRDIENHTRITWDETKRRSNLAKHGLDFVALTIAFFEGAIVRPGREGRLLAFGQLGNKRFVAVVFRPFGSEALSVISMRPASQKETRLAMHKEVP